MLNLKTDYFTPPENVQIILEDLKAKYSSYHDPWGFNLDTCAKAMNLFWPLYKHYFNVRVHGVENVQDRPYMVAGNHTGQIPIDAILVTMAFALDVKPPRILRGMVERFLAGLPFLGDITAQTGSILGDRKNCQYLLEKGESILVFPEGVRGISKNTKDYYKLQPFTKGFFRIALQTKVDILPIAIIGAEEFYPYVYHLKKLASLLQIPSMPITPTFPFLGPLGLVPMPSPVDIYIGKPIPIPEGLSPEAWEKDINEHIFKIETQIKELIENGLKNRRNIKTQYLNKEFLTEKFFDVVNELKKYGK